MTIGEKVKIINSKCENTDIRICYSGKENLYFLYDTKYKYRIYSFVGNEIEEKSEKDILIIKDRYLNGKKKLSAIQRFKEKLNREINNYGVSLKELNGEKIIVNTINGDVIFKLDKENLKSIKDFRLYTLKLISKLS